MALIYTFGSLIIFTHSLPYLIPPKPFSLSLSSFELSAFAYFHDGPPGSSIHRVPDPPPSFSCPRTTHHASSIFAARKWLVCGKTSLTAAFWSISAVGAHRSFPLPLFIHPPDHPIRPCTLQLYRSIFTSIPPNLPPAPTRSSRPTLRRPLPCRRNDDEPKQHP